ncbi:MAG: hypothetical protein PHQ67_04000 [Fermentimonas sp.]|nr:hypothetical protein [Fermentimonas sp.]
MEFKTVIYDNNAEIQKLMALMSNEQELFDHLHSFSIERNSLGHRIFPGSFIIAIGSSNLEFMQNVLDIFKEVDDK